MEQDCENWIAFKLFDSHLKIKKEVVPHRNLSGIADVPINFSQLSSSAEKRKRNNIEEYAKKQKLRLQKNEFEEKLFLLTSTEPEAESINCSDKSSTSSSHKSFVHKTVQVNIESVKSVGVNTN